MTSPRRDSDAEIGELYRSLGLRTPFSAAPAAPRARRPAAPAPPPRDLAGVGAVTVVSKSHVAFARLLADGLARHHPELPLLTVVADLGASETLEVAGRAAVAAETLGVRDLPWLALGLGMSELCCVLKPFALRHAFARGLERVVYLDADLDLHAPLTALLELLGQRDLAVTPHLLHPEASSLPSRERPSLAAIGHSGWINAGLFGMRHTPETSRFLDDWSELVTSVSAFLPERGGLTEQAAFNKLLALADSVGVLRDPGYNVAYWNLHERPLRRDDSAADSHGEYRVAERPLVVFHFSGFDPARPTELTSYREAPASGSPVAVSHLLRDYSERLRAAGWQRAAPIAGRWDRWPSGGRIAPGERRWVRWLVADGHLDRELDPWTAAGESAIAARLLVPQPAGDGLVPPLLGDVYRDRADVRAAFPEAPLDPYRLLDWTRRHGASEGEGIALFLRHRNVVLIRSEISRLLEAARADPTLFDGLDAPLAADLDPLLGRLEAAGRSELASRLRGGALEIQAASPLSFLRSVWKERADLRERVRDPLGADARGLRDWLERWGEREYTLPVSVVTAFERAAGSGALSRLFAWCLRHPEVVARWPLAFVGRNADDFALELLAAAGEASEFDLDDVVAYLWLMESAPANGVPWLFELPLHQDARPSSRSAEGQERLLAELLAGDRRFRIALEGDRARFAGEASALETRLVEAARDETVRPGRGALAALGQRLLGGRAAERSSARGGVDPPSLRPGVNLFGDAWSQDERGLVTAGLAGALSAAGVETASVACSERASVPPPANALLHAFRADFDTNLLVADPSSAAALLRLQPRHRWQERAAIAHLSWEQRDGHPDWPERLARFDTLWAPSSFAAAALERTLARTVSVAPPAVILPAAQADAAPRFAPGEFVVLALVDDVGAFDRLDPGAAAQAFLEAFRADDRAVLLLRIAIGEGGYTLAARDRLRALERRLPDGAKVRVETGPIAGGEARALLERADCYLSLHRAQAFGYRGAQAMALGKPVVATGYSGNLDFMNRDNVLLVSWAESEVEVDEGAFRRGARWAQADLGEAAHHLRRLHDDRAFAAALGERARRAIAEQLSPAAAGARLAALLGLRSAAAGAIAPG